MNTTDDTIDDDTWDMDDDTDEDLDVPIQYRLGNGVAL